MNKNTKEKLEIMIEAIKNKIKPNKIILFGSFAKGTQKEDSDIDICVITDHNKRKIDMLRELRLSTIGKNGREPKKEIFFSGDSSGLWRLNCEVVPSRE